jgi:hypothetical protein
LRIVTYGADKVQDLSISMAGLTHAVIDLSIISREEMAIGADIFE